jgi:hypothetical protein
MFPLSGSSGSDWERRTPCLWTSVSGISFQVGRPPGVVQIDEQRRSDMGRLGPMYAGAARALRGRVVHPLICIPCFFDSADRFVSLPGASSPHCEPFCASFYSSASQPNPTQGADTSRVAERCAQSAQSAAADSKHHPKPANARLKRPLPVLCAPAAYPLARSVVLLPPPRQPQSLRIPTPSAATCCCASTTTSPVERTSRRRRVHVATSLLTPLLPAIEADGALLLAVWS